MKYLLPTLWCLLLASAIACNKDKKKYTCIAQGKVVEAATGRPIEGVRVKLQDGVGNSGPISVGNTSSGISSEGYTNSNGEFNLKLEGEYSPFVSASKEKYFDFNGKGGLIQGLKIGTNSNLIFTLESEAYLNPIFKSTRGENIEDSLILNLYSRKTKDLPLFGINALGGKLRLGKGPHNMFFSEPWGSSRKSTTSLFFKVQA